MHWRRQYRILLLLFVVFSLISQWHVAWIFPHCFAAEVCAAAVPYTRYWLFRFCNWIWPSRIFRECLLFLLDFWILRFISFVANRAIGCALHSNVCYNLFVFIARVCHIFRLNLRTMDSFYRCHQLYFSLFTRFDVALGIFCNCSETDRSVFTARTDELITDFSYLNANLQPKIKITWFKQLFALDCLEMNLYTFG